MTHHAPPPDAPLLVGRVEPGDDPIAGSTLVKCDNCGRDCWLSPSSVEWLPRPIRCMVCMGLADDEGES
jgi:hypothetical protein